MNALLTISNFLIDGFTTTTIILFLAYWLSLKNRPNLQALISISNGYLIVGSLICLALPIQEILSYAENNIWREEKFSYRVYGPYWFAYWGIVLIKCLVPQILWFKKARVKIKTSLILSLLLFAISIVPIFIVPIFISKKLDYLPSSWSYYYDFSGLILHILLYCILLIMTFFIFKLKISFRIFRD